MQEVSLRWRDQWKGATRALETIAWLKQQGLVLELDFVWYFEPKNSVTTLRFYGTATQYASLVMLKWGDELV